ncbi:MAG: OPT/YSL family transporter [Akkermansiaceae bacterium]|nr:OPT/YSL family transporter [Akkermansiaceae bacterium]
MSNDPKSHLDQLAAAEERDQEWLANVYRGDKERDLTVRAVVAGMIFGGLMALSNLYVGLKSGWGLGVDIAAVIVIFAVFKGLRGIGLVKREFGMLECTTTMTVAVAASWISSAGLVSAVPALTMLTGYEFVWWQLTLFIAVILFLGLFMAIPLKRQMIQVDSLRFPANIPTGETLKAMYAHGGEGMKKAKAMGIAGVLGALTAGLRDGLAWIPNQLNLPYHIGRIGMDKLTLSVEPSLIFISIGALFGMKVGLSMLAGLILNYGVLAPNLINEKVIQHAAPQIEAVAAPQLPLTVAAAQTLTVVLEEADQSPELAAGAASRTLAYTWSQPTTYDGIAEIQRDLSAPTLQNGEPNPFFGVLAVATRTNKATQAVSLSLAAPAAITWEARLSIPASQPPGLVESLGFKPGATITQNIGGFRNISAWSLWPGATVLVVGGLLALAFQWRTLGRTFASIFTNLGGRKNATKGALDHLEIPMKWFIIGFIITGILATALLVWLFSIHWWMGVIAVFLTFFLAAVAARAGAEIGINPIGALGKVTQLTYGVMAPGNIPANLMTAGLTAGAACSCSDTVGNLKVGHMVGANPRNQFIGQIFGVFAGALLAVPAYFILVPDVSALGWA